MYRDCDEIFGCQLQTYYNLDNLSLHSQLYIDSQKILPDTASQNFKTQFRTQSIKKVTPRQEISFQKHFMKQHASVFLNNYQNLVESFRKSQHITPKKLKRQHLEIKANSRQIQISEVLSKANSTLTMDQKKQFIKDLQHQEKLSQFLVYVVNNTEESDAAWLVQSARMIWILYTPHQRKQYQTNQLIQLAEVISREPLIEYLQGQVHKFKNLQPDLREILASFIEIFSISVLLVIRQYFANPCYIDEGLLQTHRRVSNYPFLSDNQEAQQEQEWRVHSQPIKKRKASF